MYMEIFFEHMLVYRELGDQGSNRAWIFNDGWINLLDWAQNPSIMSESSGRSKPFFPFFPFYFLFLFFFDLGNASLQKLPTKS